MRKQLGILLVSAVPPSAPSEHPLLACSGVLHLAGSSLVFAPAAALSCCHTSPWGLSSGRASRSVGPSGSVGWWEVVEVVQPPQLWCRCWVARSMLALVLNPTQQECFWGPPHRDLPTETPLIFCSDLGFGPGIAGTHSDRPCCVLPHVCAGRVTRGSRNWGGCEEPPGWFGCAVVTASRDLLPRCPKGGSILWACGAVRVPGCLSAWHSRRRVRTIAVCRTG